MKRVDSKSCDVVGRWDVDVCSKVGGLFEESGAGGIGMKLGVLVLRESCLCLLPSQGTTKFAADGHVEAFILQGRRFRRVFRFDDGFE